MIKIYIDLATRFGWTFYKDNKIVDSGWVDLANDRTVRPMYKRTKQEQMEFFGNWLKNKIYFSAGNEIDKETFIIEQPSTAGMFNSSRKTLALFGICDLVIGEYREIKNSVWFKWCKETYPELIVNKPKQKKKYIYHIKDKKRIIKLDEQGNEMFNLVDVIDRKKTSIAIASYILGEEVKDDNRADAVCMTAYDNNIIIGERN